MARIIAMGVFAVLGKLHRKPTIRRLVLTGHVALHHITGVESQGFRPGNGFRIQQFSVLRVHLG